MCDSHLLDRKTVKSPPTPGDKIADVLRQIAPPKFMLFCRFHGELQPCNDLFEESITEGGICQTFNLMDISEHDDVPHKNPFWTDLSAEYSHDVYPKRAFRGLGFGLNVVLQTNASDLDYVCVGPVQGYQLKIHPPNDYPIMTNGFHRIPLGKEMTVRVKSAVSIDTTKDCDSTSSHYLEYFSEYTQSNCLAECASDFVKSECGCVHFSMFHHYKTEVCGQPKTKCIQSALKNFTMAQKSGSEFHCNCKPSCNRLTYSTETSTNDFDFAKTFEAFGQDLEGEFPGAIMSRLSVFITDDSYKQSVTVENSFVERLAKVGIFLAIFLGASLISLVEVLFYIFRRISG